MTLESRMYVVECYTPGIDGEGVRSAGERMAAAVAELHDQDLLLDYLGALFLPGDEVVFHLFSGRSSGDVREASLRAGVEFARVLESIPVGLDSFGQ